MNKEDWKRLVLHLPWGGLAVLICLGFGSAEGVTVFAGELVYEGFNDWRKGDASYKDVLGIVWGFTLPLTAIALWRLLT